MTSFPVFYSVYRIYEVQSYLTLIPCLDAAHPDSRFPIPDSRFPIPCSLFPVPCSRLLQEVS
ncbi:hypothetical protein BJP36_36285 [Moorena producens JHB]|uniref:Uncharacterized protein n=1 Tax=Moorena producens (strain JHB) TaxID=1454205 RepID=A0A9Q9STU8_MOOP1|nr:hypothetical protein [Moorena producens]WAN69549.1 hypothetical protein BJP36_36285 [Moorena producens JHB]